MITIDDMGLLSNWLAALAGLFGGLSVSFFWQPKKLYQRGRLTAGIIIGGISVSTTFTLGGIISQWLGMNFTDKDTAMGIGYFIGSISVGMVAWLANFFCHREERDILQVAGELKRAARGVNKIPGRYRSIRSSKTGDPS
ncbi:hypothetical protein [Enterobacter sp. R4-368]|uniref:hypothetical protein n=1 Tax=Enterobacter sp. R4-368 TaxID=1166130 RepID=UPI00034EE347|nr:hypothetical protein [Enterobacter sp. R4-368]AGN83897.1 hypothetical protein H650_01480 [Enterobacter sp. R4-368]